MDRTSLDHGGNVKKLMILLGLAATAAPLAAQQPAHAEPRVLSVTGTGVVQRQPDRAVLIIAVESHAATAQAASTANARKMDAVFMTLRRLGIVSPAVQTVSYGLQPEYGNIDRTTPTPRVVGYAATNMVRVQVDSVPRVGTIIDAVVSAGANRIDNLSFELRDPESARLEALRKAVERARNEAEVVATAAGQKLGRPRSISTSSGWEPRPMYRPMAAEGQMAAAPPTPVEAGSLSVTATVNITYELEDR